MSRQSLQQCSQKILVTEYVLTCPSVLMSFDVDEGPHDPFEGHRPPVNKPQ